MRSVWRQQRGQSHAVRSLGSRKSAGTYAWGFCGPHTLHFSASCVDEMRISCSTSNPKWIRPLIFPSISVSLSLSLICLFVQIFHQNFGNRFPPSNLTQPSISTWYLLVLSSTIFISPSFSPENRKIGFCRVKASIESFLRTLKLILRKRSDFAIWVDVIPWVLGFFWGVLSCPRRKTRFFGQKFGFLFF